MNRQQLVQTFFPEADKISIRHPIQSIRLLVTENARPAQLAMAAALGVFLGALPLIACHSIVIIMLAGLLRLNRVAALTASQLCMPPVVPALCIEAGYWLRHGAWLTEISIKTLGYEAPLRLWEWLLGSLIIGPILAGAVGLVVWAMAMGALRIKAGPSKVEL